jgi:hypothetical protein
VENIFINLGEDLKIFLEGGVGRLTLKNKVKKYRKG